MIHYTLLPEKELRTLKREYRIRLTIFVIYFLACSVFVGICALLPSYIYSYSQEKELLVKLASLQEDREKNGSVLAINELAEDAKIIKKLKDHGTNIVYTDIVSQIIGHKPSGLTLSYIDIKSDNVSATTSNVVLQGTAGNREQLIKFRDNLEFDQDISKVELPISDLAKNKNIPYVIKAVIVVKP
jgi:hypothetical protein